MVRILVERVYEGNLRYIEATGLSTDSKPEANIITGSAFVEVNTGKAFLFDESAAAGSKWKGV